MLDALVGGKTVKKVLLFLFVNEKCYGSQIQRALKTPLTPIQKALARLENGGLITSYYEGKTRLYQFNPSCPFIQELEQLLKKAYTHLPPQEMKLYTFTKEERGRAIPHAKVLHTFWQKLAKIKKVLYQTKTKSTQEDGWNGQGKGDVNILRPHDHVIIFQEKGLWKCSNGDESDFSNTFRWTLDRDTGLITLEHLRHGINQPCFLFHLTPTTSKMLTSLDSHLCQGDIYLGLLTLETHVLKFNWRIIGPKKNAEIEYIYS